jgi:hypothetical protein
MFHQIKNRNKRIPLLCKAALNIAFIQTDLSEAALYFVGQ